MRKNLFLRFWILIAGVALQSHVFAMQNQEAAPGGQIQNQPLSPDKSPKNSPDNKNAAAGETQKQENWYSMDNEIKLGQEFAKQVDAKAVFIQDPMVTEYVARLGQNLVRNSDSRFSFAIKVIDSDEIKAFALPGGILYVNSGLLLAADNEAELAAMMSHAIAHVNARHVTRIFTRTLLASPQKPVIQQKLIVPDYCSIYAMCEKDELNVSPVFFRFARGFEMEADWLGVQYIYKAGYDPNGFLSFLGKREQTEKKAPLPAAKFPTHPTDAERIAVIEKEITSILPANERYVLDTLEFEQVKARVASLKTQRPGDVTQR